MKSLDYAIAQMRQSGCVNCSLDDAIFDNTGESVNLVGSFCGVPVVNSMILLVAYSKSDNKEVWRKECDTGRTCTIPFTSQYEFDCYNDDEE
jgi:hypothetical protein